MDFLKIFFLLVIISGCGTTKYVVKQGWGQLSLQWSGIPNEKVLNDPKISEDIKFKIRLIEDAKAFFTHYFEHKSQGIYTKTVFLDEKAVSYLVIASKPDDVEAFEHSFPFVGSFPYLGFFSKSDAKDFKEDLEEDGLVTYVRPVLAYSTLGYFEDRILSSFFEYEEVELVELVFHEMFHTLFFAKNEVELNENLASYFAHDLLDEYYKDSPKLKKYREDELSREVLHKKLVRYAQELKEEFKKMKPNLSAQRANEHTRRFVHELLIPAINEACASQGWEGEACPNQEEKWNQARLAALLTYEEEQDFLRELSDKKSLSLRAFFQQIESWYASWKKGKQKDDFTTYLRQQL
ncbi:MAG: aminopeptidase [Bacteriovoracaceae bacterium]|nr:aminopeptidase [Bacteriovoracaceae bacterium]